MALNKPKFVSPTVLTSLTQLQKNRALPGPCQKSKGLMGAEPGHTCAQSYPVSSDPLTENFPIVIEQKVSKYVAATVVSSTSAAV